MPVSLAPVSQESLDALWMRASQRVLRRAAHEVKNALNHVSVNLEVVRSRTLGSAVNASSVGTFASSAADGFEKVMEMSDAVLGLGRAGDEAQKLGTTMRRFAALLVPAASADQRRLDVEECDSLDATTAPASAARLAIAESLLGAIESSAHVVCRATDAATLRIESRDGASLALPGEDVLAAVRAAGIEVQTESTVITISFPPIPGKAAIV